MQTILDIEKEKCTGCEACVNICPVHAIEMKKNYEGFFYPEIIDNQCVSCSKCYMICPSLSQSTPQSAKQMIICNAKSVPALSCSSSGGIFCLLAEEILEQNGCVCGAIFDANKKSIVHEFSDNCLVKDIFRSKYVQSGNNNSYKEIKNMLDKKRKVLYCGTPCQVYGLNKYLGNSNEDLLTVDFICHGVPSPGLFEDMIRYYEQKENSQVTNITFREKTNGWRNQVTRIYFSNGTIIQKNSKYFFWYNLFLSNYSLRESCMNCDLWNAHQSDITLADAWEYQGAVQNENLGISKVYCNNNKGKKEINRLIQEKRVEVYLKENEKNFENTYEHRYSLNNRSSFFKYYQKHGFKIKYCELQNLMILIQRIRNRFLVRRK